MSLTCKQAYVDACMHPCIDSEISYSARVDGQNFYEWINH